MLKKSILATLSITFLCHCAKQTEPVKIAINPWPGYEFLYLAQQKSFYQEVGLNIELVPLNSLSDIQRAYISGRVDGLASTMIEAVQSQVLSTRPLKIVLLPDYSNGGDIIIAKAPIDSLAALHGKRVGCEISSLGIYLLHRALNGANLSLNDVELINLEQSEAAQAFKENLIDAFVTYPPISIDLLKLEGMQTIFTSAEIPYDIIDTVSVAGEVIKEDPQFVEKLLQVWQRALDYAKNNPEEAYQIMASRQGISTDEFTDTLENIKVLNSEEQRQLFSNPEALQDKAIDVCSVLVDVDAIKYNCDDLFDIIYR